MDFLKIIFAGNSIFSWLQALFITFVVLILFRILKSFVFRRINVIAERTNTQLDDLIADLVKKTNMFFLSIIAVYVGSTFLNLPSTLELWASRAAILVLFLQIAFWGNVILNSYILKSLERKKDIDESVSSAFGVIAFFARIALWSILILIILDNMGFDISPLVASLGVGGVAIALATQKILGDVFCSLAILLDKPFVVGDYIVIDQFRGNVEYIGVKTTRLRSLQGEQIVISNADLLDSRIQNYKRMKKRRIAFNVGITYQTPYEKLKKVQAIIKEIIEKMENTEFVRARFFQFGDYSLIFEVVYFVQTGDYDIYMLLQEEINLEIFRRFEEEKIEFAYPTQTLFLKNDSKTTNPQISDNSFKNNE